MNEAAYLVFNPFRDVLSKGQSELSGLETAEFPAAKQARNLLSAMKDLDKAYNAVGQVVQDKDPKEGEAEKVAHGLAMAVTTLKTIFGQYVDAYGT
jgi:hypothetical protein